MNKKAENRASFIQKYRQKLQRDLDDMGYRGGAENTGSDDSVVIDAWGQVCQKTQDPSSMGRRVSLIR